MCTRPVELARYQECTRQGLRVEPPAGFVGGRCGRLISSLFASCSNANPRTRTIQDHTHTILLSAVALGLIPRLFLFHNIPVHLVHLATRLTYSRTNVCANCITHTRKPGHAHAHAHRESEAHATTQRLHALLPYIADCRAPRRGTKTTLGPLVPCTLVPYTFGAGHR